MAKKRLASEFGYKEKFNDIYKVKKGIFGDDVVVLDPSKLANRIGINEGEKREWFFKGEDFAYNTTVVSDIHTKERESIRCYIDKITLKEGAKGHTSMDIYVTCKYNRKTTYKDVIYENICWGWWGRNSEGIKMDERILDVILG